ncbi:MAG: HAD-IIIC family phosphatase [Prosthecobacter sp.]
MSLISVLPQHLAQCFDGFDGTQQAYSALARKLQGSMDGLPEVRVALLATCTIEMLKPFLVVEGARRGLRITVWCGPYGQVEQQALDPQSELHAFRPDVVCVVARLEDWAEKEMLTFSALNEAGRGGLLRSLVQRAQEAAQALRRNTSALLLWSAYAEPSTAVEGSAGLFSTRSLAAFCAELNLETARQLECVADTRIFDLPAVVARCGLRRWHDHRMSLLARMPFSGEALAAFGASLARAIRALRVPPRKCLVLDLDNTLWGGVLGEAGMGGIKIGDAFPGNAHLALQKAALALRGRGVLLAIASKNNPEEALEALAQHPDILLRPADFAALEIHWEDKAVSLRRIAARLNIGTDALVFIDDNPVERDWIRSQLPEVAVLDLPASVAGYAAALQDCEWFDAPMITRDDTLRAGMMSQQVERQALQEKSASLEEFLAALDMRVQAGPVTERDMERVVQLMAKTNQFNLTTRRHTRGDLERMLAAGAVAIWQRVSDRFGDNGLTGLIIAVPDEAAAGIWRIDTLLLSCRVIGRGLESALLATLAGQVAARGGQGLLGEFVSTQRNDQTREFYSRHQFQPADDTGRFWSRPISPLESFAIPAYLTQTYDS